MKRTLLLLIPINIYLCIHAQDLPPAAEQQVENLAVTEQGEPEDDSYEQTLEHFRNDPLNLNTADENDLKELKLLSELQISRFLQYRHLLGKIVDKYELQAVPGWDLFTIRRLLPYICINASLALSEDMHTRFSNGQHSLLMRASQQLERTEGYTSSLPGTKYLGSPQHFFIRYMYSYKKLLQFGITGDKDAGEPFLSGTRPKGFDFYSFHFFIANKGIIQSLVLGDFTVNMGQGLIQWQSMAFKKSGEVMEIKRQSPVIRPYNSAGEFNFHRGVAVTLRRKRWETTIFLSLRKLSAAINTDSSTGLNYFSSFQSSGYHRTIRELADRNNLHQAAGGGSIKYLHRSLVAGINWIGYKFSATLQKRDELYNLYAVSGDHWFNASTQYSYTYKNLHAFGEAAIDQNKDGAFVNGMMISVDPAIDLSVLYRNLSAGYRALNGNAFTENTSPENEKGWYTGIIARPTAGWQLSAYADVFRFPWLKYQVDAPSQGKEFFIQLIYTPNRQVEIYTRYKSESKQGNLTIDTILVNQPAWFGKQNWRTQINYKINTTITWRMRMELVWCDGKNINRETGFLLYTDGIYKPLLKPFSGIVRLAYFETTGYDARVYAYENDVLYSYSVPALSGKGYRYYLLLNYDINRSISCWARLSQTIYNKESAAHGAAEITIGNKTELKLQVRWIFIKSTKHQH